MNLNQQKPIKLLALILTLLTLLPAGAVRVAEAVPTRTHPAASMAQSDQPLNQQPLALQYAVSDAMGRDQVAYHPVAGADGWRVSTPSQHYTTHFDDAGFRMQTDSDSQADQAKFQMQAVAIGYGTDQARLPHAEPSRHANRVEYRRGNVTEWYVNGPLGLQQGFTVARPPGPATGAPLTLHFDLDSNLTPHLSADRHSVSLHNAQGQAQLRYGDLVAYDATGRVLPAWLSLQSGNMQIQVVDQAARYPLTIDPFIQNGILEASNADSDDEFGFSVAISGDTVVVGAPDEEISGSEESNSSVGDAGAAYVFVRSGDTWSQQAYLKTPSPQNGGKFGYSVAISGETIVVGAPFEDAGVHGTAGAAYVFVRTGSTWSQQAFLKGANANGFFDKYFGTSVAISDETIVVGIPGESAGGMVLGGGAYVFVRSNGSWSQQAHLKDSDPLVHENFGWSVAISGDTVVVGAPHYSFTGEESRLGDGDAFVFVRSGSTWNQQAWLQASNAQRGNQFGYSVGISGDTIVVGAPYETSTSEWGGGAMSLCAAVTPGVSKRTSQYPMPNARITSAIRWRPSVRWPSP